MLLLASDGALMRRRRKSRTETARPGTRDHLLHPRSDHVGCLWCSGYGILLRPPGAISRIATAGSVVLPLEGAKLLPHAGKHFSHEPEAEQD